MDFLKVLHRLSKNALWKKLQNEFGTFSQKAGQGNFPKTQGSSLDGQSN